MEAIGHLLPGERGFSAQAGSFLQEKCSSDRLFLEELPAGRIKTVIFRQLFVERRMFFLKLLRILKETFRGH